MFVGATAGWQGATNGRVAPQVTPGKNFATDPGTKTKLNGGFPFAYVTSRSANNEPERSDEGS